MKYKNEMIIGVLGGMGTYATIDLFEKYAKTFPALKEWDRPRIIIDNNCTMPSRVRAILFNENKDDLVKQMSQSINSLINAGATHIILACNTSHLFLPDVYRVIPKAKNRIISIIDNTVDAIEKEGINEVFLLATEGTIESRIYQNKLEERQLKCIAPDKMQYEQLRLCIEAVKQDNYSDLVKNTFLELANNKSNIVLGCTELPVLFSKYMRHMNYCYCFDPIQITLNKIKKEYEELQ